MEIMKKLMLAAAVVLGLVAAARERGEWKDYVVIRWEYEDKQYPELSYATNLWFRLFAHTNIAEPMANWPLIAVINGTNRQAKVQLAPGHYWFTMTASNWWGESVFSNVAEVYGPPSSDSKLSIGPE